MQTQHSAIKIGESCLAVPLLGEELRRRAGDGRHGEPLRELAQALVRAGTSSAIVLGAGIGEWAADLMTGGVSSVLCVEDDTNAYARLNLNASHLGGFTHQALIADMPAAGGSPILTFNALLGLYPSFEGARLLAVSARFGPDAIASALEFVRIRRPALALEVRLDALHCAETWKHTLERLAENGFDRGLAFDPLGHPLGSVTPERASELIDALESTRAHGGGLTSLTLLLASLESRELLGEVRARIAKRTAAPPAHRIAVVRLDGLGDHVLGAGIFAALRASFPHSRIAAVIQEGLADLYARCPSVDAILTIPPPATYNNPPNWRVLTEYLRSCCRFDLVICPRFADDDYYLAGAIGAALAAPRARVFGFKQVPGTRKDYAPNDHFSQLVEVPDTLHAAQYAGIMAHAVTGRPVSAAPEVWWKPQDWEKVAPQFGLTAEGFVVVGIGASVMHKVPSMEIYKQIVKQLLATSHTVVLVGSAAERGFADVLRRQFVGRRVVSAAGALRIPQLAALLAHARLYVGPDSGPKHIAAAARTPVLEIGWVPEDYPATSRGDLTGGRCWNAWGTLTRIVYPDGEAFRRAREHPQYRSRPLTCFDPQCFQQQFECAMADLLALPAPKARISSVNADSLALG